MITRVLKILLILLYLPHSAYANIEWALKKQLNLESAPLDISTSSDGQWVFILTSGEILLYSIPEDKVKDHIPVDRTFDRLTYSSQDNDNTLILSSSSEKTLKIIQIKISKKIDISGLPFKGPENAPVTIAVFSDYQ